jgi:hypothetical protein
MMAEMTTRFDQLRQVFTDIGVSHLIPGFYDDPAFITAERQMPDLLNLYAEYSLLAAPKENSEEIACKIRRVISFLAPLVEAHGLDGKCMPTTLLLQRFLDKEGVWNFPQIGGAVVHFPQDSGLQEHSFEPTSCDGGTYGHSWTIAPPFIIDLTITKQFYSPEEQQHVQGFILTTDRSTPPPTPFVAPPEEHIQREFPSFSVSLGTSTIAYYPYGIGGPTETFEAIQHPVLDGLAPYLLFQRFRSLLLPKVSLCPSTLVGC